MGVKKIGYAPPLGCVLDVDTKYHDAPVNGYFMEKSLIGLRCRSIGGSLWTPNGFKFDGSNDYLTITTPFSSPNAWTYMVKFEPTDTAQSTDGLIGQSNSPRITMQNTGQSRLGAMVTVSDAPGYRQVIEIDSMILNKSHGGSLLVNGQSKTIRLYRNRELVASSSWAGTLTKPSSTHYLNYRDANKLFRGYISEARIFNYDIFPLQVY